jgi:hypothetical protein
VVVVCVYNIRLENYFFISYFSKVF